MATPDEIAVTLSMLADGFNKAVDGVNSKLTGLGKEFDQVSSRMQKASENISSIGKKLSTFVTLPILAAGAAAVKSAAEFEKQQTAFTTMLGSADKAKVLLGEMEKFAASTPFQLTEITEAGKKLVAFGVNAKEVVPTLQRIGDVASGLGVPLGEMAEIYGKAKVQQTLFAEDLNQLAGRGVPIFTELAKVMKVPADQVKKLGSEGKITFTELDKVFKNLTSSGGMFAGGMDKQSQTLLGTFSNLQDNFAKFGRGIGEVLIPYVKAAAQFIGDLTSNFMSMDESSKSNLITIGLIVAAIGPFLMIVGNLIKLYKTWQVLQWAVSAGMAGTTLQAGASTTALAAHTIATKVVAAAMWLWNAAISANPLVTTIAIIVAATGVIVGLAKAFSSSKTEAEKAKQMKEEYKKAMEGLPQVTFETRAEMNEFNKALSKMSGPEKLERLNDLLQEQKNKLRGLAFEDERREKILDRISAIQQDITRVTDSQTQDQIAQQKSASEQWLNAWKSAQEKYKKFNEEFGKNEIQLENLRYSREQKELEDAKKNALVTEQQYAETKENLRKEHEQKVTDIVQKEEERRKAALLGGLDGIRGMASELGGLIQMSYDNQQAALDNRQTKEMEAIATRYNAEKADIEATIVNKTDRDAALKALDEKRAREEKTLQEKTEKEKRKLAREAAKMQKEFAIFDTALGIPKAGFDAYKSLIGIPVVGPVLAPIAAAAAVAFGLAKMALIKAQPLPQAARGLYGETPFIAGEAGPELAFPLSSQRGKEAMALMAEQLLAAIEARLGQREVTPSGTIVRTPAANVGQQAVGYELARVAPMDRQAMWDDIYHASQDGLLFIAQRAVTRG